MASIQAFGEKVVDNLERVIVGKHQSIELIVIGLLCQGHVLIEDVPGVGKTVLARSLARSLACTFNRLQFTPDMLPSDVTGVSIYNQQKNRFEFRAGPIIGQIILADEINRATPKTQAALLEAMEERQVTVDGVTHILPKPFMVLATQNPIEYEGTFPLPEAQLDRFLLRVRLGYPSMSDEIRVLDDQQIRHPLETLKAVAKVKEILDAAEAVKRIYVSPAIKRYIVELTTRTRQSGDVYLGASPRGSLGLARAGQARAALVGRDHVLPDDIQALAGPVLSHRIIVSPAARLRDLSSERIMQEVVQATPVPGRVFDGAAPENIHMRAGRILVLILILAGTTGILVNGASIFSRLLYLGILLGAGSWIWTFLLGRSLRLNRSARVQRANVGDIFDERFDLVNGSRLFAPWIEVTNISPLPFASGSRLFTLVNGRQKRNYLARTWLTRRGAFALGPTRIAAGDPFGLFRWTKEINPTQSIIVLPLIFEITAFLFPPGLLPGGRVIRRKSPDITPHASGVREYVHGDAMKRIHWPTSIRRNQLMVKEFEQDPQAEVWLFLDSQRAVHVEKSHAPEEVPVQTLVFGRRPKFQLPPSTLEYSISIAASLAHYFLAQRRAVGFLTAGQAFSIHPAERSERQEAKILETLAFVEANGELSLAALVAAQASQLPQGSSAILITPTTRTDLIAAVEDLQRRYLRPVVVLLEANSFSGAPGTEKLARALAERHVPACIIACDADLARSLSEFSSNFILQDLRAWRSPALSQLT